VYFDFVGHRKWWYLLSLIILLPGLIALAINRPPLNFGIDFIGGNILEIRFEQPVPVEKLREALGEMDLGHVSIQAAGDQNFLIRTKELDRDKVNQVIGALQRLGQAEVVRVDHVGAVIGYELIVKTVIALAITLAMMILYITIRYAGEYLAGISAIASLLYDVLVVVGFFALFRWEVDSTFLAALLTVVGYAVHDTLIIFGRVKENLHLVKKEGFAEVVNKSINQTLRRSINTVVTVVLVLLSLFFLGGESTRNLVLAMLIGTVFGCYSSIFNASQLWVDLHLLFREQEKEVARPTKAKAR